MKGFFLCPECDNVMHSVMTGDYSSYLECSCGYSEPEVEFDPFDHEKYYDL